jgi:hypothetical protein
MEVHKNMKALSLLYSNYSSKNEPYTDCVKIIFAAWLSTADWLKGYYFGLADMMFAVFHVSQIQLAWTVDLLPAAKVIWLQRYNTQPLQDKSHGQVKNEQKPFQFFIPLIKMCKFHGLVQCEEGRKEITFKNLSSLVHNTKQPCKARDFRSCLLQFFFTDFYLTTLSRLRSYTASMRWKEDQELCSSHWIIYSVFICSWNQWNKHVPTYLNTWSCYNLKFYVAI